MMKMTRLAAGKVDQKVWVGTRRRKIEKVKITTGLMRVRMKRNPWQGFLYYKAKCCGEEEEIFRLFWPKSPCPLVPEQMQTTACCGIPSFNCSNETVREANWDVSMAMKAYVFTAPGAMQ